ncbi:MAG: T9SS type A sorting domain-containing protein, partial [Promethearchaeota archaeon]
KYGEWIEFTAADKGWDDEVILHEYAHAIHNAVYNGSIYFGGEEHPNHEIDSVTNKFFAFCEGWAEFMSAIVPDDTPDRVWSNRGIYKNIEYNNWWMGPECNNIDGSKVEGAVASALYDMQDDNYDEDDEYDFFHECSANLYDLFPDIFRVFDEYSSYSIKGYAENWKKDDFYGHDSASVLYLKNSMIALLRNQGIVVPFHADIDFISNPPSFTLSQNYPNPFNSQTVINYLIPSEGMVNLVIYNILGQKVKTCVNQNMIPGYYKYVWDARDDNGNEIASGVYIYRLSFNDKQVSKLMLLLK